MLTKRVEQNRESYSIRYRLEGVDKDGVKCWGSITLEHKGKVLLKRHLVRWGLLEEILGEEIEMCVDKLPFVWARDIVHITYQGKLIYPFYSGST